MGFLLCTFCFRSPNRLNRCDWEPHRRVVVWIKMNQYEFGYLTWPHNRCFYCEYKYNTQESIVIQAIVVESNLLVYLSSVLKVGREYFPTTTTRCQQKFTFEPCQLWALHQINPSLRFTFALHSVSINLPRSLFQHVYFFIFLYRQNFFSYSYFPPFLWKYLKTEC